MACKDITAVSPFWVRTLAAYAGRRALKTYLSLYFFHILSESRRASAPENDILTLQHILAEPHGVDNMLRTQQLGDHVGRALQLERVMRWQPSTVRALYDSHQHTDSAHGSLESGLFKVRGTCVEALVGAIYHYRVRISCCSPLGSTNGTTVLPRMHCTALELGSAWDPCLFARERKERFQRSRRGFGAFAVVLAL